MFTAMMVGQIPCREGEGTGSQKILVVGEMCLGAFKISVHGWS